MKYVNLIFILLNSILLIIDRLLIIIDESMKKCNKCFKCKQHPKGISNKWDPLLLIIPLRLGLNEFNLDYKEPIKVRIIDFFFVLISPSINYFFNKKKLEMF